MKTKTVDKTMLRTVMGIVLGIIVMLLVAYLPSETETMPRVNWVYLGCFFFMLITIISNALPDWTAVLATMVLLLIFNVGGISTITAQFSGSTVWLCIGVFIMSIGINNSGLMKRIAYWILSKFPDTYSGQVTAMMLAGIIVTPIIPNATAKSSIMAPLINETCESVGIKKNSKQALCLWFANFIGTNNLSMAFISGSTYVAFMLGFIEEEYSWVGWFSVTFIWYLVMIILSYIFCRTYGKGEVSNLERSEKGITKEKYSELGSLSLKEKQTLIIMTIALILWVTQSIHGIDTGVVAILADIAFIACGIIKASEVGAKGNWTLILFVGGVLSVGNLVDTLGISTWISQILGGILSPIMVSPYIFVPCLVVIASILRLFIYSQVILLAVVSAIFAPLLSTYGIASFVLIFVACTAGQTWNMPYQQPPATAVIMMANRAVDFNNAKKASFVCMGLNLIALFFSIPLWQAMGLC